MSKRFLGRRCGHRRRPYPEYLPKVAAALRDPTRSVHADDEPTLGAWPPRQPFPPTPWPRRVTAPALPLACSGCCKQAGCGRSSGCGHRATSRRSCSTACTPTSSRLSPSGRWSGRPWPRSCLRRCCRATAPSEPSPRFSRHSWSRSLCSSWARSSWSISRRRRSTAIAASLLLLYDTQVHHAVARPLIISVATLALALVIPRDAGSAVAALALVLVLATAFTLVNAATLLPYLITRVTAPRNFALFATDGIDGLLEGGATGLVVYRVGLLGEMLKRGCDLETAATARGPGRPGGFSSGLSRGISSEPGGSYPRVRQRGSGGMARGGDGRRFG